VWFFEVFSAFSTAGVMPPFVFGAPVHGIGELRGFAPIGMLECWNSGIMGSGILQCWINGPSTGGIDDKIKMVKHPFEHQYSIVPLFHYSISGANSENPKNFYILSRL